MRNLLLPAVAAALAVLLTGAAARAATIDVDLSTQTMHVRAASGNYDWPISSARSGFVTPRGRYGVQRLEAMHYSRKYHNSPMPHSIFFRGGYAIHGTYATASLGMPASHGCIRIAPENAALLYGIVRAEGARIAIAGSPLGATRYARAEQRRRAAAQAVAYGSTGYGDDPYAQAAAPLAYADTEVQRAAPGLGNWLRAPTGRYRAPPAYGNRARNDAGPAAGYGYGYGWGAGDGGDD